MNLKQKNIKIVLAILIIALIINPGAGAVKLIVKVNETLRLASDNNVPFYGAWYLDQELAKNNSRNIVTLCADINNTFCSDSGVTWENQTISTIPECNNATWCFNPEIAFTGKNPAEHNEFQYTPNASDIGYHNITFRGVPLMGVPYEYIHEWKDVFVGTLFVANGDIVNATTRSTLAEPMARFNLTTFVENTSGIFVQESGDNGQIQFIVSLNFFNLTDGASNTVNKTLLSNGTNYVSTYNATNKNGTFEISLNKPYAEKLNGQRINVSVTIGQVKVSPRSDVNGNFQKGDIQDLTTIRRNLNKPASYCPRCDVKTPYDGLITMDDYNQTVAEKGPVTTV